MRRIRIDAEAFVAVTNLDERVEVVRGRRRRPRMNFVTEFDSEFARVLPDLLRFFNEPLLPFLKKIVAGPGPESPWITGRHFPTEGDAPEHRHDFEMQLRDQIEQF